MNKKITVITATALIVICLAAALLYTLHISKNSAYIDMPDDIKSLGMTDSLPVISITATDAINSHDEYTNCLISVFNTKSQYAITLEPAEIRLRGNSSAEAEPPPYRIKFKDNQNLLGLSDGAKEKSWVLLTTVFSCAEDVKSDIAFRIAKKLIDDDGYYSSDSMFVHVYMNGQFHGIYLLAEQNQVNKNRVNVTEPKNNYANADIGYFVELDGYDYEPYFMMDYSSAAVTDIYGVTRSFIPKSYRIKSDVYNREQTSFISSYMINVFDLIYRACEKGEYMTFGKNYELVPSTFDNAADTVSAVIDVRSFVDMYILYEIMHDCDVGGSSFFFCVDFSRRSTYPRLTLTAPWDFSWACDGEPEGVLYAASFMQEDLAVQYGDRSNPWFIILAKQDWFNEAVKERWNEIGGDAIIELINGEREFLAENESDFNRVDDYAAALANQYLDWVEARVKWLDTIW